MNFGRKVGLALALAAAAASPAQACRLRVADRPIEVPAVVVGLSSPEETARETQFAIGAVGGAVTPRYVPLPRILSEFTDASGQKHRVISAVTDGAIPAPGSSVVLRSRYLDPENDCQFIPWTVKSTTPVS